MAKLSTQERHEDIMFDPNLVVEVKENYTSKTCFTQEIFVSGSLAHKLTVTDSGSTYEEF